MNRSIKAGGIMALCVVMLCAAITPAQSYDNFKVAIYSRAYETREMNDLEWLEKFWTELTNQVHIDKIYLETHRDLIIVDDETLETAKKFFTDRGVEVAGGITYTINEMNNFETFDYANPEHRQKAQEIIEHTAKHFDEIILDDFFFTSTKSEFDIKAKGDRSWTEFRLALMDEAARNLIVGPAKKVNPKVKVVIKYPNWYEHFQGLGFNLETEPKIFDGLYTGTETRDAVTSNQHLQQYHGFLIFRYFENLKPGGNGGGWVDTGGSSYMDRYAEQLWITMFAKAPEITLFDVRGMQGQIRPTSRAAWQGTGTSFDFDSMMQPIKLQNGTTVQPTTIARAAGYTFEQIDKFVGELGNPIAVKSYKPYHSVGEDFLQTYIGQVGIPIELVPEFPVDEDIVFLTQTASFDPDIVKKIQRQLIDGKEVIVTSGFYQTMQGKGIEDIVELRVTNKKTITNQFPIGWSGAIEAEKEIVFPEIYYLTNDSWEQVSTLSGVIGYPILHAADYGNGTFYVLTIPDSFGDLYALPAGVLNRIRQTVCSDLPVRIEGPANVSLFPYDNDTFIVESFLDEPVDIRVITDRDKTVLRDLVTAETVEAAAAPQGGRRGFGFGGMGGAAPTATYNVTIKPHSYRVFKRQ